MTNEIIDGISLRLNELFGDGYEIYADESVKQGLKEPCFFIRMITSDARKMLGPRYMQNRTFDIQYFPKNEGDHGEMFDVGDRLYMGLEYIRLSDGLLRGIGMRHEAVDGVLHFFVDYNIFLFKIRPGEPTMNELELKTTLKG